ncbi:SRPBCC family protein [Intrasporangium sp. DVR]|uniref:SRPBCC family protein n=1 Tax=Intrasporangium sp. DVR TaxID=3127867 RepID=UPI00313A65B3
MELTHSFTVPTSVDEAWSLLTDLKRVGDCFPGATVTEVTDEGFTGTVKVKLGPISLVYGGSGSFVAKDDEGHRAVIEAKGKDKRGNGTAGATVTVQLTPDGGGARADVVTDLAVTGKPAQFGRGVMQDVSDKLLGQFIACIERELGGGPAPDTSGAELISEPTVAQATSPQAALPQATVQDAAEAASRPEIITVAVPEEVRDTGAPLTLSEEVARSKAEASEAAAAAAALRRPTSAAEAADDALDLGSAVLPVLVQRYSGYAVAAALGVLVGWLLGRRRS